MTHDLTTTLRSELAALEYKRDRLMSEVKPITIFHSDRRFRSDRAINSPFDDPASGNEEPREVPGSTGARIAGRG